MMATVLRLGPDDHGRPMTLEEYEKGDYEEGFLYELFDGKLYVSPVPNAPQGLVELWLTMTLQQYWLRHPEVLSLVYNKTRVFVPDRPGVTSLEPDIAAYKDFPNAVSWAEIRWEELNPVLVVEILSADDPHKDLVRNVELYFQVPSIKEYWIFDNHTTPDQPTMRWHRRHGKRWIIRNLDFGDTYTTRLLPGFELIIDPRR